MQRDLTKRYSLFFKKQWNKNPFTLLYDIYKYGKLREFSSFVVWELFHRLGLFPRSRYLKFSSEPILSLENENLETVRFDEKVNQLLAPASLTAMRSSLSWKMLFLKSDGEMIGCVFPNDTDLYRSSDQGQSVIFLHRFPESIKSIFVSSRNTIFVCAKGAVYRSADGGTTFQRSFELGSSESFLRFNNAMTETPGGELMFGEYGNVWDESGWRKLAFMYFSSDDGETWEKSDFLIRMKANKHVHIVKYSRLLNRVIVADGDNYKRLWLSEPLDRFDIKNPKWQLTNRLHIQTGGHTAAVETDDRVFFGTDYQGGTNFVVETADGKRFTKRIVPDPYRRSPIDNMVVRRSRRGCEIWANLPFSAGSSKCLLMYSQDNGATWNRVFEYRRSEYTVWLISTSSTVSDQLYVLVSDMKNGTRAVYKITDSQ
jgi:hypothetical protein